MPFGVIGGAIAAAAPAIGAIGAAASAGTAIAGAVSGGSTQSGDISGGQAASIAAQQAGYNEYAQNEAPYISTGDSALSAYGDAAAADIAGHLPA